MRDVLCERAAAGRQLKPEGLAMTMTGTGTISGSVRLLLYKVLILAPILFSDKSPTPQNISPEVVQPLPTA